ncbi:MAG: peptidoglycan DD-metalloendopeptidase family protein [Methylococcaceae bacterium]|nr:peptidoglycan DD-metalloendopeptidase family protein [Methylococcaceae bacterium]
MYMPSILTKHLKELIQELALGYGWVSLLPSQKAGALLFLITFIEPQLGTLSLVGAVCAWYAGALAGANKIERPICVFNGLLIGLYIAYVWHISASAIALTVMGGVFAGWITVVLGRLVWSSVQLPILSLPFALVAMLTSAAGSSLTTLQYNPYLAPPAMFGNQVDKFFSAIGNFYFLPNPFIGLLIACIIFICSRYYLLLALLGYITALSWLKFMGAAPEYLANTAWDSNAILASLLVGGLFASPSLLTACLGVLAAIMACWMSLALGRMVEVVPLVPFSSPFVLASWLVLYAVVRNTQLTNRFNILLADFPERSFERTMINMGRTGDSGSISLALPFMGIWTVSQGFSGEYTHRGAWRYALDFIVMKNDKSYTGKGNQLDDFYAYNLPVLSPVYGQVWRVVNDIPDNQVGTVNVTANWGNCVVIRLNSGLFVIVAHLKPNSVAVYQGAWVSVGDLIGYCGNSGRSPQPHIHLHVQTADDSVSPTIPFHLASVLISDKTEAMRYELAVVPKEASTLLSAVEGNAKPFYLFAGRGLRYRVTDQKKQNPSEWTLHCEVDLQGRLVLISSAGARCIAESTWAIFSCYERSGAADPYFDLWLLACGYTPTSLQVEHWYDRYIPARLLPKRGAKLLAAILWPWANFAKSDYYRHWDEEAQMWRQKGVHTQQVSGIEVTTEALIAPQLGCTHINAETGGEQYTLQASSYFQRADMGVPAWESILDESISFSPDV